MACCVDRCTNPLSLVTKLPNYTSDKFLPAAPLPITAATSQATAVLINSLSLIRNYTDSDVLVEGVVQVNIDAITLAAITGTLAVTIDVYRTPTSTLASDRIYSVTKTLVNVVAITGILGAIRNVIPFQFTDNENTTNYVPAPYPLPDGLSPATYYVRASILNNGITLGAATITVVRSDASASEEVVFV
ncbi:hypothetical protein [Clostridium sp. YIM B02551]|uniref:hypothetical protein n=1 Tax=Clostridium sp. YIM B02551 TaxID=2910679 RepID=UPI001EECE90F|nr:hypothetical protein [Clostridium sp. YIM B02551]